MKATSIKQIQIAKVLVSAKLSLYGLDQPIWLDKYDW